jgi:hypothetical protein
MDFAYYLISRPKMRISEQGQEIRILCGDVLYHTAQGIPQIETKDCAKGPLMNGN